MFEMLHSLSLANFMYTPISGKDLALVGFVYVDDSDLFVYLLNTNTEEMATKMQVLIDSWEKSSKVTGGSLSPDKCWWYLVDFKWDQNCNWQYIDLNESETYKMQVNDSNNHRQTIQYLPPHEAQEMLDVYLHQMATIWNK